MPEIRTEGLSHVYGEGTPFERTAIENISLSIPQGQFVAVIGRTGSGKSTFVQHLNALLPPSAGRVLCGGADINRDKAARRNARFQVGLVFQYPEHQLFEETVLADIAFGPKNMGLSQEEVERRVREAAGFVGVEEALLQRSPMELSGGQKRRAAIAGVIAMRPEVLILDEPTAGLDPAGCAQITENIRRYREQTGSTVILVSHSMDEAAALAERLLVFDRGHVAMDGSPEEIFSRPEELEALGLAVPSAAQIALELRRLGLPLPGGIFRHDQLVAAILERRRAAPC